MGEDLVDLHLSSCPACRAFAEGGSALRRRLAVRAAEPVPDLTGPILAAARAAAPGSSRPAAVGAHWSRWALLAVALTQLALAAPPLFGHDGSAPVHLARELGAWDLALAGALLLVVARPRHANGLVPFAGALAGTMVIAALVDVASGRVAATTESLHLLDLLGLVLLLVIARRPTDTAPLLDGFRRPRPALVA